MLSLDQPLSASKIMSALGPAVLFLSPDQSAGHGGSQPSSLSAHRQGRKAFGIYRGPR
jgi:hypothetical protein